MSNKLNTVLRIFERTGVENALRTAQEQKLLDEDEMCYLERVHNKNDLPVVIPRTIRSLCADENTEQTSGTVLTLLKDLTENNLHEGIMYPYDVVFTIKPDTQSDLCIVDKAKDGQFLHVRESSQSIRVLEKPSESHPQLRLYLPLRRHVISISIRSPVKDPVNFYTLDKKWEDGLYYPHSVAPCLAEIRKRLPELYQEIASTQQQDYHQEKFNVEVNNGLRIIRNRLGVLCTDNIPHQFHLPETLNPTDTHFDPSSQTLFVVGTGCDNRSAIFAIDFSHCYDLTSDNEEESLRPLVSRRVLQTPEPGPFALKIVRVHQESKIHILLLQQVDSSDDEFGLWKIVRQAIYGYGVIPKLKDCKTLKRTFITPHASYGVSGERLERLFKQFQLENQS